MIQNINIARVSLITHGSLSALRTLDGVYIPRDRGVLGWAGYRRGGSERMARRRGGEREKRGRRLGVCLCAFKGSRTAFGRGPLWHPWATNRHGRRMCSLLANAKFTMEKSPPLSPAFFFPFVGPIMPWHNSSKILWLVDHWIWRYLARFSGPRWRQWSLGSDARLLNQADRESLSFLQRKKERDSEKGKEPEGEVKNMIFSLLDVRRVSGISYGSRVQWPRLFGMLGKMFLTMMKLDVRNSKRGGNMSAYNTLFSLKITFVICNVEFRWFLSGKEPLGSTLS